MRSRFSVWGVLATIILAVATACTGSDSPTPSPHAPDGVSSSPSGSGSVSASVTPSPTTTSWGPPLALVTQAQQLVAAMPVEQKAGQVIMARVSGTTASAVLPQIHDNDLGGVILFDDNIESPDQVRDLNDALTADATTRGSVPLLIGVDQEGGIVTRISKGVTALPTYMTLGAAHDPDVAEKLAAMSSAELRALGFTLDFAPDADVTSGPDDPTIGSRSASSDPAIVADMVQASVRGYLSAGVIPVIKHFPGHGSVPENSHETLPVQTMTLDELRQRDFVPFREAIAAGVPSVMVGHIDLEAVDPGVPSSLSGPDVALLRDELGFEGVAFTDAQEMGAVSGTYGAGPAAVMSLDAGNDVVLMPTDPTTARVAIVNAVGDGSLPAARLDEAATRVVTLALWQASIAGDQPDLSTLDSADHQQISYASSLSGATIVAGSCTDRVIGGEMQIAGATAEDRTLLADAAQQRGVDVGSSGPLVRLLPTTEPGDGDVVVSLDTPYGLADSDAATKIALYGRTPEAFVALMDVLTGANSARGRLPVAVEGVDQQGCQ